MKTTLSAGKRDFPGHKFSRPIVERIFTPVSPTSGRERTTLFVLHGYVPK